MRNLIRDFFVVVGIAAGAIAAYYVFQASSDIRDRVIAQPTVVIIEYQLSPNPTFTPSYETPIPTATSLFIEETQVSQTAPTFDPFSGVSGDAGAVGSNPLGQFHDVTGNAGGFTPTPHPAFDSLTPNAVGNP